MAGTAGIQTPLNVYFTQTVAGAANNDYTIARAGVLVDAWCIARAAQNGGTFQVSRVRAAVANGVTDAMAAAVDQVVARAGTINDAFYAFAAADSVRFQTVGAATQIDAVVTLIPPVASSATVV